ncbi:MAG: hypothetical protein Kilf2KO_35150 [Rhodospirillales bacterium]
MKLLRPNPVQAEVGLRAMKAVALAGGGFKPAASAMIAAAQRHLLGTDLDFESLEPATPQALAAAFDDPDLGRQIIQGMVLMAIADDLPDPGRMTEIGRFAAALGVDEPGLQAVQELAERQMLLFRIDFYRRSHLKEAFRNQYQLHGLSGLVKGLAGQRGLYEDPELAARYRALGTLDDDSLGRAFHDHYRRNGFAFPGEKLGFPEAGVYHDFTHVLAGYTTEPEQEVMVGAFQAGYMRVNPYFMLLFVMLTFGAGLNVTPVPQGRITGTLALEGVAERVLAALDRGSKVKIDLSQKWNHWDWVETPLEQARRELGIEPLSPPTA